MNPPPPPPPPTPFPNPSSFTFNPNPNPNPNLSHHPQHTQYQYHQPSVSESDLPTTLSTLKDLIHLSQTTLQSLSSLLPTTSPTLSTCPFNSHHRIPPESLFRHSLTCPSSPSPISPSLLNSLHYPTTLQSSHSLLQQNPFIQSSSPHHDLCFSLDQFADPRSNFFYRDCPGVVTLPDQDATNAMLTLPAVLSTECANFSSTTEENVKDFSLECFRLLPSETWVVRTEIAGWDDYPTSYSYNVVRAILCLRMGDWCDLMRWVIVNSVRYGVVIDVPMRDHMFLLFRLCLKAITREAVCSWDLLFKGEVKELDLKSMGFFNCPVLGQVLMWLGAQLAVLYGEVDGKLFAVEMLKQCLVSNSLDCMMFSQVQKGNGLKARFERSENEGDMIFVSQVAAAVAALHERSLLEGKIKAIRFSRHLPSFQRMNEHAYISKRADEERQKRSNYRPIIEHDGLLWQRARNQETSRMKSREELLAEERDYKRRRTSYRGKKMKRSTTQVMRDIIEEYTEEIKQAGGFDCLLKGAEESGMLAFEPSSVHDISADNELDKSLPNSSEVSRGIHSYNKQLPSHNNIKSTRFRDKSLEDEKWHRQDLHRHQGHLEERISDRDRHVREYYSRSPDGQRSNGRPSEKIANRGLQDDADASRKYLPRSSDRSHSRSHEQTSHRRDRVDQYVEDKDRRRSSDRSHVNRGMQDDTEISRKYLIRSPDRSYSRSHEQTSRRSNRFDQYAEDRDRCRRNTHSNRSDSVTHQEFEDRYDPSEPCDV